MPKNIGVVEERTVFDIGDGGCVSPRAVFEDRDPQGRKKER
jgi:hypothetical protein